jgi:hypothetical protein
MAKRLFASRRLRNSIRHALVSHRPYPKLSKHDSEIIVTNHQLGLNSLIAFLLFVQLIRAPIPTGWITQAYALDHDKLFLIIGHT